MTRDQRWLFVVRRMWDIHFALGVGLFVVALSWSADSAAMAGAFLAFNAGVSFCTWADRFLFDQLRAMCAHLARVADEQQRTIDALRQQIEGNK